MPGGETERVASNPFNAELHSSMVRETTGKLLARVASQPIQQVAHHGRPAKRTIGFVHLDSTRSAHSVHNAHNANNNESNNNELGDFREPIRLAILEAISQSDQFDIANHRVASAGLLALNLRPDDLFMQENMRMFTHTMRQSGTPIDYLLFARISSGAAENSQGTQRDYALTLKLVCMQTFTSIFESASMP